jgi:hypothetical protein
MAVLSWRGVSALQRAKALHPARRTSSGRPQLSPADPMPPAAKGEDTEDDNDIRNLDRTGQTVTPGLRLMKGGATG